MKNMIGFVFVTTSVGHEREVYNIFVGIPEIVETYPVLGEYDFILKIKAGNLTGLQYILFKKIKRAQNVLYAELFPAADFESIKSKKDGKTQSLPDKKWN